MVYIAIRTWLLIIFIGIGTDVVRNCSAEENSHNGHSHHHIAYLPSYARNVSIEAQNELKSILKDKTSTKKQQIEDEIKAWAKKQGPETEAAYAKFLQQKQSKYAKLEGAIKTSNLSSNAREALLRIYAVKTNMSLTIAQEKNQAKEILHGVTKSVQLEMKRFLRGNFPKPKRYRRRADDHDSTVEPCDLDSSDATLVECLEVDEEDFKPPFLDKLSPEAQNEFYTILHNTTAPQRVVMEEMKNWAKQQGAEIEAAVHELIENDTAEHIKAEKVIEKLPVNIKVREALLKIVAIDADENLSIDEQVEQIKQVMIDLPDEMGMQVVKELVKLDHSISSFHGEQ